MALPSTDTKHSLCILQYLCNSFDVGQCPVCTGFCRQTQLAQSDSQFTTACSISQGGMFCFLIQRYCASIVLSHVV